MKDNEDSIPVGMDTPEGSEDLNQAEPGPKVKLKSSKAAGKKTSTASSEEAEAPAADEPQSAETSDPESGLEGAEETDQDLRRELREELDQLVARLREVEPDYEPPPFSPKGVMAFLRENLDRFPKDFQLGILEKLRDSVNEDLFDIDTWKGVWYMLNYTVEYRGDQIKRRFGGDYETDEWGMDWEYIEIVRPFYDFMYKRYFRVETTGIDHVPEAGRALLVCNHSGQLPWDGAMVVAAVLNEHPAQRLVRTLYATWFPTLPFFSDMFQKGGQVLATVENGSRLLEQDELVSVFPEGYKGVGKLFKDRYRLARFGRGGFVKMAMRARAPIIPVSVVGAEETYISLYKSQTLAKLTGFPYFPISTRFPWLGLLGFVPFPTKWFIDFGEPIPLEAHPADAGEDLVLVSQLSDQVRNIVQEMINDRLGRRRSIFFG